MDEIDLCVSHVVGYGNEQVGVLFETREVD